MSVRSAEEIADPHVPLRGDRLHDSVHPDLTTIPIICRDLLTEDPQLATLDVKYPLFGDYGSCIRQTLDGDVETDR